jgi:hypothetical protein
MRPIPRLLSVGLLAVAVAVTTLWGELAPWFALPLGDGIRGTLSLDFVALGLSGLAVGVARRRLVMPLLPSTFAAVAVLAW